LAWLANEWSLEVTNQSNCGMNAECVYTTVVSMHHFWLPLPCLTCVFPPVLGSQVSYMDAKDFHVFAVFILVSVENRKLFYDMSSGSSDVW